MTNNKKYFFLITLSILLASSFYLPVLASESNGTIDPSHKYAWGENLGWLNFGCDNCDVQITDTEISGYAWSRQYGWINLSPTSSPGVINNCAGQLSGSAWSSNLGWIDFSGTSIDMNGRFSGISSTSGTQSGRVTFDCTNCNVQTDWRQCSLRESPAQVVINSIIDNIIPSVSANITISNEGTVDTEYEYEWCVVTSMNNACGGGDDVFYASAAKLIEVDDSWTTNLSAIVSNAGSYWFKLVVHYGEDRSTASYVFSAQAAPSGGGGGGGGGSGGCGGGEGGRTTEGGSYSGSGCSTGGTASSTSGGTSGNFGTADFNRDHIVDSVDFSILLFFWKTIPPFKNIYVDINKDNKVDSIDFSILLSQWGKRTI